MRKEIQMLSSQSLSILISVISLRKRNPYNTRIQYDIAFYYPPLQKKKDKMLKKGGLTNVLTSGFFHLVTLILLKFINKFIIIVV